MPFNSPVFPLFFFVVWGLYLSLRHRRQNRMLLAASYIFYGWWDWRFVFLLFATTTIDYHCARFMERNRDNARRYLLISLISNLGVLSAFKYFDFFSVSAAAAAEFLGFHPDFATIKVLLPIGISFYTFQSLAYIIDVYRRKTPAADDYLDFALFVAYFPQLVAGPISRADNLLPAIRSPRRVTADGIRTGMQLVLMGYFKKVFIADGVAPLVDRCFHSPADWGGINLALGAYLFAIQIYGDFSGYTDIARGVSRFFGIDLCLNFRQPYLSTNITEFWRRWHMSLSSWLRDYLYISLGGNRKGAIRTYLNLIITMLLGGLWHGAAWHFVTWGLLHGVYLSVHKLLLRGRKIEPSAPPRGVLDALRWLASVTLTFNLVAFAWVFFRSDSWATAIEYISHMVHRAGVPAASLLQYTLFYGGCTLLIDAMCAFRASELPVSAKWRPALRGLAYATMIILLLSVGENHARPFIYFQF